MFDTQYTPRERIHACSGSRVKQLYAGRYELLKEYARENRKNMTLAESFLWQNLRANALDHKFLRQHVIGCEEACALRTGCPTFRSRRC